MHSVFKAISAICHPLIMPLFGVLFYFANTPRFTNYKILVTKLISVSILTIILPIITFFLLNILGKAQSVHLKSTKERVLPLLINISFTYLVITHIFIKSDYIELHYFFWSILVSTVFCLLSALVKIKASIHMMSISGFFVFVIALSLHYNINLLLSIAITAFLMGAVGSSRLHLKAHTNQELIVGLLIGIMPQLALYSYWV